MVNQNVVGVENKKYLGDGVYADFDGYHVRISTEGEFAAKNIIFLDLYVAEDLIKYLAAVRWAK